jgi:deoxyribodipyrimidine photo-lyase
MKSNNSIALFWFRRDLRLEDNTALNAALKNHKYVLPIFIFDSDILEDLRKNDPRVTFIHKCLESINEQLKEYNSSIKTIYGRPIDVFKKLLDEYKISDVYINKDYEPYSRTRDKEVFEFLNLNGIKLHGFKDQVIFERLEIIKDDGSPYTVFTPYKKKWLRHFSALHAQKAPLTNSSNFLESSFQITPLDEIEFTKSTIEVPNYNLSIIEDYSDQRDFPSLDATSYLSTHLRFGTISIREIMSTLDRNTVFFSELIWREFFKQILYNFPRVITSNFKSKYDGVEWRNNRVEFKSWCEGKTGYPIVDAAMNQLNTTGLMHNRLRMIVAGFLCKHLLIDWRWGEAYFASKLLDYDLSANNGNWQWAAGTGCDAAPYFRIFNPTEQQKKFDKDLLFINEWNPKKNYNTPPIVEHKFARSRALSAYKRGLIN